MKNNFEYKGYVGTVTTNAEDGCFYGTVQGIKDLVTFEGDSIEEVKKSFEESVDDYLEFCEENGIASEKA